MNVHVINPKDTPEAIFNNPSWDRQVLLEEDMRSLGIERYRTQVLKNVERGSEMQIKSVTRLAANVHEAMAEGVREFVKEASTGKAGRRHVSVAYIAAMDADLVAHLTIRSVMDAISGPSRLTSTAIEISTLLEDEVNSAIFKEEMPKAHAKFKQRAMTENLGSRKWSHLLMPAELLGVELKDWPKRDKLLVGVKLIEIMVATTGMIDIEEIRTERHGIKSSHVIKARPETLEWIAKENSRLEWMFPTLLPTIVPPKPWTSVYSGGYWTRHIRSMTLVKTRNRAYLEELNDRPMEAVYAAVNAMQETAWVIHPQVLDVMENLWKSGVTLGGIPQATDDTMPEKPAFLDVTPRDLWTEQELAAFKEWKGQAFTAHKANAKMKGDRFRFARLLWVARKFIDEDAIYFPHQLDWRGRAYPVPMYLNPQGDDMQRGLLTFSATVPITDQQDADWLAIHGAGLWGVDKVAFDERVQWVIDNSAAICAVAEDPYENRFWLDADKPWSALAFCFDWAGFCKEGFGYHSALPIQMDGTCNGLQNFSAMLKDPIGGAAVNLVPGPKPSDIYAEVAAVVNKRIALDISEGNPIAAMWQGAVNRTVCKRPVMTLAYGARQFGFVQQVETDTIGRWAKVHPDLPYPFNGEKEGKPFDYGFEAARYLGAVIWDSVGQVVVAARQAMDWLQEAARVAAKEGLPVLWTTPTGFLVQQAYRVSSIKAVETTFEKIRIQLSLEEDTGKIDSRRQASGISPNWIHSLDASHLMLTIATCREQGMTSFSMIHDSYGTHAGNAWAMAEVLRQQFVQMYTQVHVLQRFKEELEHQTSLPMPDLPADGDLDLSLVLESPFFFA